LLYVTKLQISVIGKLEKGAAPCKNGNFLLFPW
jgi:hypothetical protein